ncbi:MAG TPA: cysteine--tRNA ligase [Rhizomicrobium sp.]
MTLRLYDTLTKQKQTLEDLPGFDRNNVRMYVCGPTVYDFAHIGNARPVIVFDVLFRLLKHLYEKDGGKVTYVRNVTDIDDKINARAAETAAAKGISVEAARAEITTATAKQFDEDVAALGCLPPTETPRATQYVPQMIAMIETLVAAGHAYVADPPTPEASADKSHGPAGALAKAGGHVLFDVSSKPDYGKLAKRSLDEMLAGARVEVAPYKKNPMDFVLWKPSDASTPGWESPWGRGRPGWHIECSTMGGALLGDTFDIHGGGIDLMFPHHENEIAQSEGAHHGRPLARVWMHNGFLQVEGEKMSKSLGNFITIRDLLKDWPGEVLRFNMLRTHYRQPIDWTLNGLKESHQTLERWYPHAATRQGSPLPGEFVDALLDDLNTPKAIAALHEHAPSADALKLLGFSADPSKIARSVVSALPEGEIAAAIEARAAARKAKNFKESDRIRDELLAKGIVLKDGPTGTTWEVKR